VRRFVLGLAGMEHLIHQAVPEIDANNIILVPARRNTLPHTLWALAAIAADGDEPVVFKGTDLYISNPEEFTSGFKHALASYSAQPPALSLLSTPYQTYNANDGYCLVDKNNHITSLLEKPTQATLEAASQDSQVYRSPFMYIATKNILAAALLAMNEDWLDDAHMVLKGNSFQKEAFLRLPFMDISSSLFSQAHSMKLLEVDCDFLDVGRFQAVYQLNTKDSAGNVLLGNIIVTDDCHNNLIINQIDRPLVIINQRDMVIVQTAAGSLAAPFDRVSEVGEIYKSRIHN